MRSLSIGCPRGNLRDVYELYLLQDVFQQTKPCWMPLHGQELQSGARHPQTVMNALKKTGEEGGDGGFDPQDARPQLHRLQAGVGQ